MKTDDKPNVARNPILTIWKIINFPMALLGLLSLSDSLITFDENIQNILNSYQEIIYPIFSVIFSWAWFEIPNYVFDYFFLGLLYASSVNIVWKVRFYREYSVWINHSSHHLFYVAYYLLSTIATILFWPILIFNIQFRIFYLKLIGYDYNSKVLMNAMRIMDLLVLQYLGAILLVFTLILIFNYVGSLS